MCHSINSHPHIVPSATLRAVVCRHLDQLAPRTGAWEAVHGTIALVGGDMSNLDWQCMELVQHYGRMICPNGFKVCPWSSCAAVSVVAEAPLAVGTRATQHLLRLHDACCSVKQHVPLGVAVPNSVLTSAVEHGHLHVVQYLCSLPTGRGVDPGVVVLSTSRQIAIYVDKPASGPTNQKGDSQSCIPPALLLAAEGSNLHSAQYNCLCAHSQPMTALLYV